MSIEEIKQKINFRQPKYMLPAILYIPVLVTVYFIIGIFTTEKAEIPDTSKQTTDYINPNLPGANIKGDGIGGKYDNMKNSFGMIDDASAVNIIERTEEDTKEDYESKYSDEELALLEEEAQRQAEQAEQEAAEKAKQQTREQEAIKELERALAEARLKGQMNIPDLSVSGEAEVSASDSSKRAPQPAMKDVGKTREEDGEQQVVKKVKVTSDYFNTLAVNEKEPNMIKAIIDENIKAVDGSRVRLRLLDDVEIGDAVLPKGSYLYATMSGFGGQRVKGTVTSVMVYDEIIKINLSIYDTDGLEGLYVPSSSFRETSQDVAGSVTGSNMTMSSTSSNNSLAQWGRQAAQNAYSKTTNAISKAIKKNRAKLKYGTFVYLINSKNTKSQK